MAKLERSGTSIYTSSRFPSTYAFNVRIIPPLLGKRSAFISILKTESKKQTRKLLKVLHFRLMLPDFIGL